MQERHLQARIPPTRKQRRENGFTKRKKSSGGRHRFEKLPKSDRLRPAAFRKPTPHGTASRTGTHSSPSRRSLKLNSSAACVRMVRLRGYSSGSAVREGFPSQIHSLTRASPPHPSSEEAPRAFSQAPPVRRTAPHSPAREAQAPS